MYSEIQASRFIEQLTGIRGGKERKEMRRVEIFAFAALLCLTGAAYAAVISPSFEFYPTESASSISVVSNGANYLFGIAKGNDVMRNSLVGAQFVSNSGEMIGPFISTGRYGNAPFVGTDGTNYLLVWFDSEAPANGDIYGCTVSSAGVCGTPFIIKHNAGERTDGLDSFNISFDGTNYLITWVDYRNDLDHDRQSDPNEGSGLDIYGQFVSPSGTLIGPEVSICTLPWTQTCVATAFDGTNYLVCWMNYHDGIGENWDVYGCFLSKAGAPGEPFCISQTASQAYNPIDIAVGKNGFLVVWNYSNQSIFDNPIWNIHGRMVAFDGGFPAPEFVITDLPGSQGIPRAAYDGGRYFVGWTNFYGEYYQYYDGDVYGRFIDDSGTPEGSEFPVMIQSGAGLLFPRFGGNDRFLLGYLKGDLIGDSVGPIELSGLFIDHDTNQIADAKKNPDDTQIMLSDKVVTYIDCGDTSTLYVEEPNRLSGIQLHTDSIAGLQIGDIVSVNGNLKTLDGERTLIEAIIEKTGATAPIKPLMVNNRSVGGGDMPGQAGVTGCKGINNIGLLIRTTGRLTRINDHSFTIDDGSGVNILCQTPQGILVNPAWQMVAVTGISSLQPSGQSYNRLIKVNKIDPLISGPSEGITGAWEATFTSGSIGGVFGMLLVQQGNNVSGSMRGWALNDGKINGNVFTGSFEVPDFGTVLSTLTIQGSTLTGNWMFPDGEIIPVTFQRISSEPVSPYTGLPKVVMAACDGQFIRVTWDRPINGWDYDVIQWDGSSIADWNPHNTSYDPATHTFNIPLSTRIPLIPGESYNIWLDSGDTVDWHDPYGVAAWSSTSQAYNFLHTYTEPLAVNSISLTRAPNAGTTYIQEIRGSGFKAGAVVTLERTGCPAITATNVAVWDSTKISCYFNLLNAPTGLWSVKVKNTDGGSATLPNAFSVGFSNTTPIIGCSNKAVNYKLMSSISTMKRIRIWGKVKIIDKDHFSLDDGSGCPVMNYSVGYFGIKDGDYASAFGVLDTAMSPPVLSPNPSNVMRLHYDIPTDPPSAPAYAVGFTLKISSWPQTTVKLLCDLPANATNVRLYRSTDNITWSWFQVPIQINKRSAMADFVYYPNCYYRFTAVNEGGESAPSPVVYAKPNSVEYGAIGVDSPGPDGVANVSLTPTISWHPAWSQPADLKGYWVDMHSTSPFAAVWEAQTNTLPAPISVNYGTTDGMFTYLSAAPLQSLTEYQVNIYAVDTNNWVFAKSSDSHFTTGDSGPLPPPPAPTQSK